MFGALFPRQREYPIHISADNTGFSGLRGYLCKTVEFLKCLFLGFLRHSSILYLFSEFIDLGNIISTKFFLDNLHLLLKVEFAMCLLNGFAYLIVNIIAELIPFQCLAQKLNDELQPFNRVKLFNGSLAFRGCEVEKPGDRIREMSRFFLLLNRTFHLFQC